MTSGKKGEQGFQQVISKQDILTVLSNAEKPLKNSQVQVALAKFNPRKYKHISFNGVKRVLLEMGKAGDICGGYDEDLRIYLWKIKESENND